MSSEEERAGLHRCEGERLNSRVHLGASLLTVLGGVAGMALSYFSWMVLGWASDTAEGGTSVTAAAADRFVYLTLAAGVLGVVSGVVMYRRPRLGALGATLAVFVGTVATPLSLDATNANVIGLWFIAAVPLVGGACLGFFRDIRARRR